MWHVSLPVLVTQFVRNISDGAFDDQHHAEDQNTSNNHNRVNERLSLGAKLATLQALRALPP
eukprot:2482762-Amphidinium_carterae.1